MALKELNFTVKGRKEMQMELGPPMYWLLKRAQTWVDTEGGRIQLSVDRAKSSVGLWSQVQIVVPARFFIEKSLLKSYSRHCATLIDHYHA